MKTRLYTYLIDTYSSGWLIRAKSIHDARKKALARHGVSFWGGYQVKRVPQSEIAWHINKPYL